MNLPIPQSRFSKAYSDNYERIFKMNHIETRQRQILKERKIVLDNLEAHSDALHLIQCVENKLWFLDEGYKVEDLEGGFSVVAHPS